MTGIASEDDETRRFSKRYNETIEDKTSSITSIFILG
jgi:hypothetical protein